MYPHRIRLRGPWECEALRHDGPSAPRRVTMPCRWADAGLTDFTGVVRCRRRFGYPGRIDADECVWLTCAGLSDRADVWLNGTLLAQQQTAPFEFDVTSLLHARNELVTEVAGSASTGGLWGEVALEVRCTAFLREVRVRPAGKGFEVTGVVVGTSNERLELYILLNGRQAGYETIAPAPAGRSFRIAVAAPEETVGPALVQVDLVNGATVWYTMTTEFGGAAG